MSPRTAPSDVEAGRLDGFLFERGMPRLVARCDEHVEAFIRGVLVRRSPGSKQHLMGQSGREAAATY
jgi:hypothetical protein